MLRSGCGRCRAADQDPRLLLVTAAMPNEVFNVLFLCTGNSARSIISEAILRSQGERFNAYSAGSLPTGRVNPWAIELLRSNGLPTEGLRSKSWDEFARPGAPFLHFVFTVCDQAAAEPCPIWPGQPITAHWGVADPAAVEGSDDVKRNAVRAAFNTLEQRISLFTSLPLEALQGLAAMEKLAEIGRTNADGSRSI